MSEKISLDSSGYVYNIRCQQRDYNFTYSVYAKSFKVLLAFETITAH